MSEELYRTIDPEGEIKPARMNISTAAQGSKLEVLGVPANPIEIVFYNPQQPKQWNTVYRVVPVIIRNLQFPVLLSWKDLKRLKASIDIHRNEVTLRHKSMSSSYPLVGAPRKPQPVHMCESVTVPPESEMLVPVTVVQGQPGDEVQVNPNLDIIDEKSLLMVPVIDRLNDKKQMAMRVWNSTRLPITLENNTKMGTAESLAVVMQVDSEYVDVNALTQNTQLQKARPLTKWTDIKTRQQLMARLAEDLGFNKPDHSFSKEQRKEIIKVLARHRPALSLDYTDLATVKGVKFRIPTGNAEPVRSKCRLLPPHLHKVLEEQIERWLAQKVIKECNGPWAAPIVPVPKKNGGWRFAIDYRGLNAVTERDSRPVANMSDQLAKIRSNPMKKLKYFASLDLSEAYHSIEVAEEDQPKTAMISPKGLHSFNRMTFGFKSAPQAFHELVQMIEKTMSENNPDLAKTILLYFDDCLIPAETFEEMVTKLELFLTAIEKIGLKVQPRKCVFCKQRVKWLGHIITEEGIQPDPDRVRALTDYPTPKTLEDVRGIHGMAGTMRPFIRNFADLTPNIRKHLVPLDPSNKNNKQPIQWDAKAQAEKEHLVKLLTSAPILAHPDWSESAQPFIVTVDTSSTGVGATLSQKQKLEDGKNVERIIQYASRKLRDGERHYSAYKLELCGVVTALEHFRYFLQGRKFIIRTDHKALEWLMKPKHNASMPSLLWRWHSWIGEYDYDIEWVSASKMKLCDGLSRRRYDPGDYGVMKPPMPRRDPLWESDAPIEEARTRLDDDFWIENMKKKFNRDNADEDLGYESDHTVNAALLHRDFYADHGHSFPQCASSADVVPLHDLVELDLGTCFMLSKQSASPEVSHLDGGRPAAQEGPTIPKSDIRYYFTSGPMAQVQDTSGVEVIEIDDDPPEIEILTEKKQPQVSASPKQTIQPLMDMDSFPPFDPAEWSNGPVLNVEMLPCEVENATEREEERFRKKREFYHRLGCYGIQSDTRVKPLIEKCVDVWQQLPPDRPNQDPDIKQLQLDEMLQMMTKHKLCPQEEEINRQQVRQQMNKGTFNYDISTKEDIQRTFVDQVVSRIEDLKPGEYYNAGIDNSFHHFIRKQQATDRGVAYIQRCLQGSEKWPENENEIIKTLKKIYHFIWIGRTDDKSAGPMPPIPEEAEGRSERITARQRSGDAMEQREMRSRMHDRQVMFRDLCRAWQADPSQITNEHRILRIQQKIVVPIGTETPQKIIQAVHHSQGCFHLGVQRTKILINNYFWFPRMDEKIKKYIGSCKQCVDGKRLPLTLGIPIGQTSSLARERLKTWSMDVVYMPNGSNGYNFILTCLDLATSWLEAILLKRATSQKVVDFIEAVMIPRYGEGLYFIADQGREFTAKIVKNAVTKAHSKIHYGTIYNSQSNPVERFHRTLGGVIRCLLIDRQLPSNQWPKVFLDALRTLRQAPDTTGYSPFYRLFGQRPKTQWMAWMDVDKTEKTGGFPYTPPRLLEVQEGNVYPETANAAKPATSVKAADSANEARGPNQEEATSPPIIQMEEDGIHKQVKYKGATRLLTRINAPDKMTFYKEVFALPLPPGMTEKPYGAAQEAAQAAKDENAEKTHQKNKDRNMGKKREWYPTLMELVDWKESIDPENPNTRKYANPFQGPYAILGIDSQGKTVNIRKLDPRTMKLEGKMKTVHMGQVRPTLHFEFVNRPHGFDWSYDELWS